VVATILCVAGTPFHYLACVTIWLFDTAPAVYKTSRIGRNWLFNTPPAIYKTSRIGHNRSLFTIFKYRTMTPGAPPIIDSQFRAIVAEHDPRITLIGRFLRATKIDELPQLANVARGHMSWIGPRPDDAWMLPFYSPLLAERLDVPPGLTGFAQVLTARQLSSDITYALDVWYVRHRSLRLDAWILCATPLYIAGWRNVGRSRLRRMLASSDFLLLVSAVASALEKASAQRDVTNFPVRSEIENES
jgi:lipopolysaccharide/colanic/teichoic acid biosynthesis glycosyltransferase